jgi:NADPH:quinone reductase-like Zn-dependent oxidoreductase
MAMSQQTTRRPPLRQTAIIQCSTTSTSTSSSLEISHSAPVPILDPQSSPHHVLVRVLAVALNPTDYKMILHFPKPGNFVGCDFCGVVEDAGSECALKFPPGTRVAGAVFPYNPSVDSANGNCISSGAFSQWLMTDSRLLLKVPESWDDLQGAALGGVGWGTAGLALCDPKALNLSGRPSKPSLKSEPVVVFGGATASGTMACQVLQL